MDFDFRIGCSCVSYRLIQLHLKSNNRVIFTKRAKATYVKLLFKVSTSCTRACPVPMTLRCTC